ncbi:hypothetical protein POJ06DRAFT_267200 [Lipomyces tetrasporus]|uniref:SH3 domain-containing protein n=1 Tax=Lipomyces tetrasporus TaxID=54092 RepID=A0AAD7VTS7_9ASCO|nr:uncharacterized protein POJ06DRAFT_267200 [Lipomyces tetrasporus]KAJ8101034.1 hypothetical protein POJ06DRAFT_267200 [Lipomyces tetrasporus]
MAPILLPHSLSSSSSSASSSKYKQKVSLNTAPLNPTLPLYSQLSDDTVPLTLNPAIVLRPDSHTLVRDFAYPQFHPLHLGPAPPASSLASTSPNPTHIEEEDEYSQSEEPQLQPHDGPPWAEDPYLSSPVISTAAGGEREYFFSVASVEDEIHGRAVALFDFEPENDNEVALKEGQEIWISYRHGQGWLVAQDPLTGETGLVPEEYVEIIQRDAFAFQESAPDDVPGSVTPQHTAGHKDTAPEVPEVPRSKLHPDDDDWEDVDE